jgi:hypothetical protein
MPKVFHYVTHSDIPISFIQKELAMYKSKLPALPHNFYQLFSPGELAQFSILERVLDYLFSYIPYVKRNPYQLQVDDQLDALFLHSVGDIYFPPNLVVYDPDSSVNQWVSFAHFEGSRWEGCPKPYLTVNGGLTIGDRLEIHQALKLG